MQQSARLLFFAFAGDARIATMGEEVRDPTRVIPRAIVLASGSTVAVYTALAVTLLAVLAPAPLRSPPQSALPPGLGPLPWCRSAQPPPRSARCWPRSPGSNAPAWPWPASTTSPAGSPPCTPRHQVPHQAEVALAVTVSLLVLTVDLRGAIGFSSFGVLLYYMVANLAALTQPPQHRRFPRPLQVLGARRHAARRLGRDRRRGPRPRNRLPPRASAHRAANPARHRPTGRTA